MDDVVLIDWGTSSLRAVTVGKNDKIKARFSCDAGITNVPGRNFAKQLAQTLDKLGVTDKATPILMSGMIGSSIGWYEVPYLTGKQGIEAFAGHLHNLAYDGLDICIVPGIAAPSMGLPHYVDVMRGEETQFFGSLMLSPETKHDNNKSSLLCIPGTHAKWIAEAHGVIENFATFMTGEIFSLLSRHSVITDVLGPGGDAIHGTEAFLEGLEMASDPLGPLHQAFLLRAGAVTGSLAPEHNRERLSGICIGAELAAMRPYIDDSGLPVKLIASSVMKHAYESAFTHFSIPYLSLDAEATTIAGQLAIHRQRS